MPRRVKSSAEVGQPRLPELKQVQQRTVGEVDRGNQLGHDAHLGWEWPRLGHAAEHQVASRVGLKLVALDDLDECRLWDVGLDRPTTVGQVPAQCARRTGACQHHVGVAEHIHERLGADGEPTRLGAAAQAR